MDRRICRRRADMSSPPATRRTSTRGRSDWQSGHIASCASWPNRSCSGSRSGSHPGVRRLQGPSRAGRLRAIETAVSLAREGHVIAMFPEGTRRKKGIRKRWQAQAHTGAARIALEAGVPLVPAGIKGTDELRTPAGLARPLRSADRPRRPRRAHSGRRGSDRDRPSDGSDRGARGAAVTGVLLAVDGDSLAHRAYHAIPKSIRGNGRPANALVGVGNFLLQLWEAERPGIGARRLGFARDADVPAQGAARISVGPRVRGCDPRATGTAARAHGVVRLRGRQGARIRGRRLPGRRGRKLARPGERRHLRPRRVSARLRPGHRSCSR